MSVESFLTRLQSENLEIDFNELSPRNEWIILGQGGQATVYRAHLFGISVALKESSSSMINSDNAELLVREIRMLRFLRHPKIVDFMGISVDASKNIFIVTEYLGGGNLLKLLHEPSANLSWRDNLLQYAIDICEGMVFMHSQDMLHRDLKSANILITDNWSTAKIADLGFARFSAQVMSTRGTPRWCAPEILSGNNTYSEKVDVYSFGILLFEMCSRQLPYQNEDGNELTNKIVNDDYRPEFPENMPSGLEDIYEDCVSASPDKRPSFTDILERLRGEVREDVDSPNGPFPVFHSYNCPCRNPGSDLGQII